MKPYFVVFLAFLFVSTIGFSDSATGKTAIHYTLPVPATIDTDSTRVLQYLKKASDKVTTGQIDSAAYYLKEASTLAQELNIYELKMRSMDEHVRFLHRQLKYNDALIICEQMLTLASQAHDETRLANIFNNMGILNKAMGNFALAAENYIKALDLAEKNANNKNKQKFNSNLASLFIDLNDKEKALHYSRKGHALAVEMRDSTQISNSLVNLSCSEILNELYDDAIDHLHEMISIASHLNNAERVLDGYINLGEVLIRKKQYKDALAIYLKAKQALQPATAPDYVLYVHHGLSTSYFYMNQVEKAKYYYKKLYPDIEHDFPKSELKDTYLFGAEINEKLGAFEEALTFRKKYEALKDSLFDAVTKSSIHELELKYQNTLTKKAFAEQQLVIATHENELERKNKQIILAVSIALILVILCIIALIMFRLRQRTVKNEQRYQLLRAQLIGEEQERARQAKELHDGVSGLLSAAKMHLSLLNAPANHHNSNGHYEKAISLLNQANKEVRNISHNLAPEIILEQGLQHAIEDFSARIDNPDLKIQFTVVGEIPRLKPEFELLIYRATQESINNVIKHANATTVLLQITCLDGLMTITIEDNGSGFDRNTIESRGLGISNIRSRIEGMHGLFDITSAPDEGTTVYIEVDLSNYLLNSSMAIKPTNTAFSRQE